MDGLLLLGITPSENVNKTENVTPTITPIQQPQAASPISSYVQAPVQAMPIQQIQPQVQSYQQNYGYSQPNPLNQSLQPSIAYAGSYNGYYNPPSIPFNQQPAYPQYPSNAFQNPASMLSNPYSPAQFYSPQQFYPAYPSQPQYNPAQSQYNYQAPYQQPLTNPPITSIPITLSFNTPVDPKPFYPVAQPINAKKPEEDFGDFKNGGSFEI
jgi:hypothetical protein